MISRKVHALDRAATLVVGLLLMVGGAAAVWWWTGRSGLASRLDLARVTDLTQASWWPVAAAAVGVVLVLVGLRWLLAHLGRSGVSSLHLPGSGSQGRLEVETGRVSSAAAEALEDCPGVRSASGRVVRDRGQLVARLSATLDKDADLARVAEQADLVAADLARVLERPELRCSVELKVAGLTATLSR